MGNKKDDQAKDDAVAERIDSLRQKAEDGELSHDLLEDVSGGMARDMHTDGVTHTDGTTHTDSPL